MRIATWLGCMLLSTLAMAAELPAPREIAWEELMPAGWVPKEPDYAGFFDAADAGDPMVPQQRDAPVVAALDQQRIRLAGYIVPVAVHGEAVSEVLLVPYFGACIHTPPPPSNQVVHVRLTKSMTLDELWEMGAVWASGVLRAKPHSLDIAQAGYQLELQELKPYELPEQLTP